jgi:hypothetical protein
MYLSIRTNVSLTIFRKKFSYLSHVKPSGTMKCQEFPDYQSKYQLFVKDFAPCIFLIE